MTKEFETKVLKNYPVDTKEYRYTVKGYSYYDEQKGFVRGVDIVRLPLKSLDTTDAIDGWELVKRIEEDA